MRRYNLKDLEVHHDLKRTQMPSSCMGGWNYMKVGLFIGTQGEPSMLSERSRHVASLIRVWDRVHFGSTLKSEGPQLLVHVRQLQWELCQKLDKFRASPRLVFRKHWRGWRAYLVPGAVLAEIGYARAYPGRRPAYTASFLGQDLGEFRLKRDARAAIEREFGLFVGGWVQFTKRTDEPKLSWLEGKLAEQGIPSRRNGSSRHAPILEVDASQLDAAWNLLDELDDVADDDEMFHA